MAEDNKLVFLPYCATNLRDLIVLAEERNLPVEILETEENVLGIIKERNIKYVVGVCCGRKIKALIPHADEVSVNGYKVIPAGADEECFKISGVKRDVNIKNYCNALDWLCKQ